MVAFLRDGMPSIRKSLGARLRQLREEQQLKADDVAVWVGVDRTHLYACERGDSAPSLELLANLATAYRVDVADLFVFPSEHVRHRFRELTRFIPNAKLAAVIELVEKRLGVTLEELIAPQLPGSSDSRKKTKSK